MCKTLLHKLQNEQQAKLSGGLYHKTQIELAYNSNRIEGSRLSEDQTRLIFETHTIGFSDEEAVSVDDIIETSNHFKAFDKILAEASHPLSENLIKKLHLILKSSTSDEHRGYPIGEYKRYRNEVGGGTTARPDDVKPAMLKLLKNYESRELPTFEDIISFHKHFEDIHPFQDGNGRVGRLIMFKECLRCGITPFIILDAYHKQFYYRGLKEFNREPGFLVDTCKSAQDVYAQWIDYFYLNAATSELDLPKSEFSKRQFLHYLSDLTLQFIEKYGAATRKEIGEFLSSEFDPTLPHDEVTRKINNLLTKMRRENLIENIGSRKSPRWVLSNPTLARQKTGGVRPDL